MIANRIKPVLTCYSLTGCSTWSHPWKRTVSSLRWVMSEESPSCHFDVWSLKPFFLDLPSSHPISMLLYFQIISSSHPIFIRPGSPLKPWVHWGGAGRACGKGRVSQPLFSQNITALPLYLFATQTSSPKHGSQLDWIHIWKISSMITYIKLGNGSAYCALSAVVVGKIKRYSGSRNDIDRD